MHPFSDTSSIAPPPATNPESPTHDPVKSALIVHHMLLLLPTSEPISLVVTVKTQLTLLILRIGYVPTVQ